MQNFMGLFLYLIQSIASLEIFMYIFGLLCLIGVIGLFDRLLK